MHQFLMLSGPGVHPDAEPEAVLQEILQTAVRARHYFPRGGVQGLEANTLQVLIALHVSGEQSGTDLVDQLLLRQGTVSTALGELHDRGLVTERVDGADGRRRLQQVTPSGVDLLLAFVGAVG